MKPGHIPIEAMESENKKGKWFKQVVLGLVCANFFVWLAIADSASRKAAEIWFFDVGQGDAALVQLPDGLQIVIDGGPNNAVLEKLGRAMPFYDREIDWVVLSHTDCDHLTGLLAVLKNYQVNNILWSGLAGDDDEDAEWERLIAQEGAAVKIAVAGKKLVLSQNPPVILEVLAPAQSDKISGKDQNELSTIIKFSYGARSFLFCGDAKSDADGFADAAQDAFADVLKVSHHGSKYSTTAGFLAKVLPAAAVISAGEKNPYGHPHPEVLDLLENYDIRTLRTDTAGDIVFRTDGKRVFARTQKK